MLDLTARIVAAHAESNPVPAEALPDLIQSVYRALTTAVAPESKQQMQPPTPAVAIKRSVFPDFIVCLEDGRKLKMLKRHLKVSYGMSPDDYRTRWGLPSDYPMVAPSYAAVRSGPAKGMGLGRKLPPRSEAVREIEPEVPAATVLPAYRARGSRS